MTRRTAIIGAVAAATLAVSATPAWADGIRDSQWHLAFLNVAGAHRLGQGQGITVAVVDSGVDASHPDLAENVLSGIDVVGDGDGRLDVDGRGTALAGLIAGHGHGASGRPDGVLGAAPGARILPVAVTNRPGQYGDPDVLADGIDAAVARGVRIICIGRGLPASPRLERAVAAAVRADVVVIAPLANRPGESFLPWPAAYPGVVAVAPLDRAGTPVMAAGAAANRTPSPGPSPLGGAPAPASAPVIAAPAPAPVIAALATAPVIAAPGVDLITTDTRGGYRIEAGTGAAALAAGTVALILGLYPQLPADQVIRRLTVTATDRGPAGRDGDYGHGVLNPQRALAEVVPPPTAGPRPSAAAAPTPPATVAAPTPPPAEGRALPAFDSTDWRRWMVATPLVAFMVALAFYSAGGRRRRVAR